MLDPVEFSRLAADPARLAVLGQLALGPRSAAAISEATGRTVRDTLRLLGRLCAGGLVIDGDGWYRLHEQALRSLSETLTVVLPPDRSLLSGVGAADAAVAARYLRGSTLTRIPGAGPRRDAILRILVDEFLPGRYYAEAEVTEVLTRFHADHAALRRHLVDAGMLHRENATRTYWRGGGPPPGG